MATDKEIRKVLLVDDHPAVLFALRAVVEKEAGFEVCGEATTARQARDLILKHRPHLAMVDCVLNDEDGLALVKELIDLHPPLLVVVISMLNEASNAARAYQAGAVAYLHKQAGLDTIGEVLRGLVKEDAGKRKRALSGGKSSLIAPSGIPALSNRELQVFRLVGLGRSTKDIASALGISHKTAEAHRENIKTKLGLANAAALVAAATLSARDEGLIR